MTSCERDWKIIGSEVVEEERGVLRESIGHLHSQSKVKKLMMKKSSGEKTTPAWNIPSTEDFYPTAPISISLEWRLVSLQVFSEPAV